MKKLSFATLFLIIVMLLSACGSGGTAPNGTPGAGAGGVNSTAPAPGLSTTSTP